MKILSVVKQRISAFTLVEEVIAMGMVAILSFAGLSSISFSRAERFRDREAGIVTDFLIHYAEHLKGMSFDELTPGRPLNALYDGAEGSPLITIPDSVAWVSLNDTNYLTFHPGLVWIAGRQPQLMVNLTTVTNAGQIHTKHVVLELKWAQPLSDRLLTNRLDVVRVKDL